MVFNWRHFGFLPNLGDAGFRTQYFRFFKFTCCMYAFFNLSFFKSKSRAVPKIIKAHTVINRWQIINIKVPIDLFTAFYTKSMPFINNLIFNYSQFLRFDPLNDISSIAKFCTNYRHAWSVKQNSNNLPPFIRMATFRLFRMSSTKYRC